MNAKSPRGRSANDPRPQRVAGRGLENPGAFGPATCCEPGRFAVRWSADGPRPQHVGPLGRTAKSLCFCAWPCAANRDGSRSAGGSVKMRRRTGAVQNLPALRLMGRERETA